jgi:ethanolamine-phosphate cytidylyltransferase
MAKAQRTVRDLEEKLLKLGMNDLSSNGDKEVRIFMDGAFDMMHYGHMNAFRKGRAMGTKLIVGVNSDETITICKGAPVMNDNERMAMVRGCKFVDEVVPGVPYVMNDEYLKWVIQEYSIDYVVHGDDPCIVDGKDVYESAQKMGKTPPPYLFPTIPDLFPTIPDLFPTIPDLF